MRFCVGFKFSQQQIRLIQVSSHEVGKEIKSCLRMRVYHNGFNLAVTPSSTVKVVLRSALI